MNDGRRNARLALNLAALAAGMVMLAYASVPLYRLFCQVTGFGGTTQRAIAQTPSRLGTREIMVHFNADTDSALPWRFTPDQRSVRVRTGQNMLVSYSAHNTAERPVTGHAVYNVVPHKAGPHFIKIACFCFENQTLAANQSVHMPISFYIDPAFDADPEMRDVKEITLSYTFFPAKSKE